VNDRMSIMRALKLGSASQEMRLSPQRHLASVWTIFRSAEVAIGASEASESNTMNGAMLGFQNLLL
jgi:hypothetical protein